MKHKGMEKEEWKKMDEEISKGNEEHEERRIVVRKKSRKKGKQKERKCYPVF